MTATCTATPKTPRSLARPLARSLARSLAPAKTIGRYLSLARQRRALAGLEPHRLEDIGITRQDALREAARPVWDAPQHWLGRW